MAPPPRILLHLGRNRRLVVDPAEVYFIESEGADALRKAFGEK